MTKKNGKNGKNSKKTKAVKTTKKITRRKRKTSNAPIDGGIYTEIDQVYKALNRVQTNREPVSFIIREEEVPVVNNILRDLDLPNKKKKSKVEGKQCFEYTVSPGK